MLANAIRLISSTKVDCQLFDRNRICDGETHFKFTVDLTWSVLEILFCILIFFLCQKILRGDFGELRNIREELHFAKIGIVLETVGRRVDLLKVKNQEIAISRDIFKSKEKPRYFKVNLL